MTNTEKDYIIRYRRAGKGCAEIARELGLSANTVKSFCRRNNITADEQLTSSANTDAICLQCGRHMIIHPHRKTKRFCSDSCRLVWWHAHRGMAKNAKVRKCHYCGKIFHSVREQKYCSRGCYFGARYGGEINECCTDKRAV